MYSRFRRTYNRSVSRYSPENFSVHFDFNVGESSHVATVVGPTTTAGIRKVKNFTINVPHVTGNAALWALIYVPEGLNPAPQLNIPGAQLAASIYEPNQNIIACGSCLSVGHIVKSRLARNLGSGDSVILAMKFADALGTAVSYLFSVSYAVKFG